MKNATLNRVLNRALNRAFNCMSYRSAHAAVLMLMLALAAAPAWSATKVAPMSEEDAMFQKERAVCLTGQSNQDRATCMDEAVSARSAARAGRLESESARTLAANAMRRCKAQPKGDDRAACESKVRGEGQVSGTAAAGGVLKTMTTIEQPEPAQVTAPVVPAVVPVTR